MNSVIGKKHSTSSLYSAKARVPGLVRRVDDPMVGVGLSSKLSIPKSDCASVLKGRVWPFWHQRHLPPESWTYIDPSSLLNVYLNMGLSGPTSSTTDFAHPVNLTSSSLISALILILGRDDLPRRLWCIRPGR